jgi:hypothetical protein
MPDPVKSVEGSFSGNNEALGITTCPLSLKKSKYFCLSIFEFIFILFNLSIQAYYI